MKKPDTRDALVAALAQPGAAPWALAEIRARAASMLAPLCAKEYVRRQVHGYRRDVGPPPTIDLQDNDQAVLLSLFTRRARVRDVTQRDREAALLLRMCIAAQERGGVDGQTLSQIPLLLERLAGADRVHKSVAKAGGGKRSPRARKLDPDEIAGFYRGCRANGDDDLVARSRVQQRFRGDATDRAILEALKRGLAKNPEA